MRFLSLTRPWDWAIFDPIACKHVENRSWAPPIDLIGQEIALQSAKSWDNEAIGLFMRLGLEFPASYSTGFPHSIIRGVVTIDRVVTSNITLPPDQQRWFFGPYGWVLANVTRFEIFVPCKGALGLRHLDDGVEDAVQRELARIRQPSQ